MPVTYKVKFKRNVQKGKNEVKYYAVPSRVSLMTTKDICLNLEAKSALSRADIHASIIGITDEIISMLLKGHSVRLDGLGTFSLSLTSNGYDTADEVTPRKVKVGKLCFKASSDISKKLKGVKFVRSNMEQ